MQCRTGDVMQLLYPNPGTRQIATTCGTMIILMLLMHLFNPPQEPAPGYISAPDSKALARARFLNELPFLLNQDIKSVRRKLGYPEHVSEITGTTVTLVYKFASKGTTTKSKLDLGHLDEHEIHTVTGIDEHIYQPNAFLKSYAKCGKLTFPSNENNYYSGLALEYIADGITDADFHRVNGRLTDVTIGKKNSYCTFWSSVVIEGVIMRTLMNFEQSQDLFGLYKESLESLRVIQNHITTGD